MATHTGALPTDHDIWDKVKKSLKEAFGDIDLKLFLMIRLEQLRALSNPE